MLRILYYLCTKSGKISAKKGGGLTLRHGRTLRILRYSFQGNRLCFTIMKRRCTTTLGEAEALMKEYATFQKWHIRAKYFK